MFRNLSICENEPAILEAVRLGRWSEDLQAHLASCPACSDAALAAKFLASIQDTDLAAARVPASGWMWWRAQLQAKQAAAERAVQPIRFVEQASLACAALSIVGLSLWNWSAIRGWLSTLGGSWRLADFSAQAFLAALWAKSDLLILGSAGALVLLGGLVAYLLWAEE